jgi:TRAP-type C4-dicarboxylate transport system permease small subunit
VDAVTHAMFAAACLIVMALVVLVNTEVAARYFLNTSTLVADEYGGYALVWICLLGFAEALRTGQFLRVDAVVQRLRPGPRRFAEVAAALVGLAAAAVLAEATFGMALTSWRFGTVSIQPSSTPVWFPQLVMPLGFAWLCIVYLRQLVLALRGVTQA